MRMNIIICIGSSCHLKGSKKVVEQLQNLLDENNLADKVELSGTFCTGNCMKGVCVKIDEILFSLQPDNIKSFFDDNILKKVK